MDFGRWKSVVIVVGCVIAMFLVIAESRLKLNPQTPHKLCSVELSADPEFRKRMGAQEVVLYPPSLGFIDGDRLICSFYSHELRDFQPSGFHVLEVYPNGGFGRRLDFDTYDEGYRAMPVADGGFVVLAGESSGRCERVGSCLPTNERTSPGFHQNPVTNRFGKIDHDAVYVGAPM